MAKKEDKTSVFKTLGTVFDVLGRAKAALRDLSDHIEKILSEKMKALKKGFTAYVLMLLFLVAGLLFLLGGGLLFLSRFLSLDAILFIGGFGCLLIALYLAKK